MKKIIKKRCAPLFCHLLWLLPFLITSAFGAEEKKVTFADKIDAGLSSIATKADALVFWAFPIGGQKLPLVLLVLGGTAIFLTIYFKFINIRSIGLAVKTVRGKYTDKGAPGEITHFQALTAALSATVGLGNIAGVAIAIGMGGPGATFWMVLMGLCGMTTKFCECTLGVKYRKIDAQGKVAGGAMYYLSEGLSERGLGRLGKGLAIFFAVMCIGGAFGAGNLLQVNQATSQVVDSFGIFDGEGEKVWFGAILAVLVGMVIIGGIVWIARVTSFLVPFMCGTYLLVAIITIGSHLDELGNAFLLIVQGAFTPMAVGGGIVGVLIQGIKRAAFSNEAGVGSAPIAHSAVKTRKPASEGLVALLEPFTDTVVVCTMTALVLIVTGAWKVDAVVDKESVNLYRTSAMVEVVGSVNEGDELRIIGKDDENEEVLGKRGEVWLGETDGKANTAWVNYEGLTVVEGITKTSRAFGQKFEAFPKILAVAVLLFAFSTMISWSYYGEQAVIYLCGGRKPGVILAYKVVFCALAVVGASASLVNVVKISDAMIFAMVIPNMIGLYLLLPVVKRELAIFREHVADVEGQK